MLQQLHIRFAALYLHIQKYTFHNMRHNKHLRKLLLPTTNCFATSTCNTHFSHNTLYHLLAASSHPPTALHALLLVHGYLHPTTHSPTLSSKLVASYVSAGLLRHALLLFTHHLPTPRTVFAHNSILRGLINASHFSAALQLYHSMLHRDAFTYPLVLLACARLSDLRLGRAIHQSIDSKLLHNAYIQCALVDMYAKCGSLADARSVFDEMPVRDNVPWGAIICGTMRYGDWGEALGLFTRMRAEGFKIDSVIVATVLPACGRVGAVRAGMGLQCCAVKAGFDDDLFVSNALIDMYCKCGCTRIARRVFGFMGWRDVVTWSSLIAGYSQNCEHAESLDLFVEMVRSGVRPSSVTVASVLPSFAEMKMLRQGEEMHCFAVRHGFADDTFVATALVDVYCRCGEMRRAEIIFGYMSDGDIAVANSMITGYALNEDVESAFETLRRIRKAGLRPNCVTVVTVIPLCNRYNLVSHGKELHSYITRGGIGSVISVNNSLIDMYCKCGYLELGRKVFGCMMERDIVTYNTIIAAFGMHGHGEQAISFFEHMKEERIEPDKVTFVALLSACSHGGFIERGLSFYTSMIEDYDIFPDMEHYSCMVDLYGRSGCLEDAWEFIRKMPVEPDIDVLGSLMGACRVQKRTDLAELVSKWIFEKKTDDPGYHILLSNVYSAAGRWKDATRVRTMIKENGLMKKPGNSWIQIGCCVHSFLARDRSHPEIDKIDEIIDILQLEMKIEGYIADIILLHGLSRGIEDIHDD